MRPTYKIQSTEMINSTSFAGRPMTPSTHVVTRPPLGTPALATLAKNDVRLKHRHTLMSRKIVYKVRNNVARPGKRTRGHDVVPGMLEKGQSS